MGPGRNEKDSIRFPPVDGLSGRGRSARIRGLHDRGTKANRCRARSQSLAFSVTVYDDEIGTPRRGHASGNRRISTRVVFSREPLDLDAMTAQCLDHALGHRTRSSLDDDLLGAQIAKPVAAGIGRVSRSGEGYRCTQCCRPPRCDHGADEVAASADPCRTRLLVDLDAAGTTSATWCGDDENQCVIAQRPGGAQFFTRLTVEGAAHLPDVSGSVEDPHLSRIGGAGNTWG